MTMQFSFVCMCVGMSYFINQTQIKFLCIFYNRLDLYALSNNKTHAYWRLDLPWKEIFVPEI